MEEERLELIKQAIRQGGEAITDEDELFLRRASSDIIERLQRDILQGRLEAVDVGDIAEYEQMLYSQFYKAYDQLVKVKGADAYMEANKKSLQTKGGIKGIVKAWLNRVSIAQEQAVNATNRMWGDAFAKVITSGGTAIDPDAVHASQRLFLNELSGGNALRRFLNKQYNVNDYDRQIFLAMSQGHHDIPVLNYIGKAAVLQKQLLDDYIAKIDPNYRPPANLFSNFRIDQKKLQNMGLAGFKDTMHSSGLYKQLTGYTKLADSPKYRDGVPDAEVDRLLEELYLDAATSGKLMGRSKYSGKGTLHQELGHIEFQGADAEWTMLEMLGDLSQGATGSVAGARQAQASKMAANSILGEDWGYTLQRTADAISERSAAWDKENIEKYLQGRAGFLNGILDGGGYDTTLDHVIGGVDSFISATFTGAAFLRNILNDNTMYTGLVRNSFTKSSALYDYMANTNKILVGMVRTGRTNELAEIIEFMGISATMSQKQVVEGVANSLTMGNRKGAAWAQKFSYGMNKFSDWTSKFSGADRGNKAARVMGTMQFGHAVQTALKQSYDQLDDGLKNYFQRYGIGEKEFNILKTAPTVQDPRTGKAFLVDTWKILSDDFRVKGMRGANETSHQARVRLRNSVISLMEDGVSELVPKVQSSDVFSFAKHTNPLSKLITSAVYRFGPITMRQFNGITRAIRRGSGLDDADYSLGGIAEAAVRSPAAFAKLMSLMTVSGTMTVWAYDLKNGKTPRELSPQTIWEGLNFSGASGALGMIYMSLLYNQAIMSSPHNSVGMSLVEFAKAMADIDNPRQSQKIKKSTQRLITRMGGFTNLWYTKAVTDKLIQEALNAPTTIHQQRRLRERGQRKFLD